eukprot:scaffold2961_cov70-Skeletonema_marinoi.AAC.1
MLTFAFAGNMDPPYLLATAWLSFVPQLAIPLLMKTKFFSLITSKYAFGFRGCVIALGICGSLYNTLQVETQSPTPWVSCGLGSHPGWALHPEYGEFVEEKKLLLTDVIDTDTSDVKFNREKKPTTDDEAVA